MNDGTKVILRIWHSKKHDDFTVSEVELFGTAVNSGTMTPRKFVAQTQQNGGFWQDNEFVPWHCISYFYVEEVKP